MYENNDINEVFLSQDENMNEVFYNENNDSTWAQNINFSNHDDDFTASEYSFNINANEVDAKDQTWYQNIDFGQDSPKEVEIQPMTWKQNNYNENHYSKPSPPKCNCPKCNPKGHRMSHPKHWTPSMGNSEIYIENQFEENETYSHESHRCSCHKQPCNCHTKRLSACKCPENLGCINIDAQTKARVITFTVTIKNLCHNKKFAIVITAFVIRCGKKVPVGQICDVACREGCDCGCITKTFKLVISVPLCSDEKIFIEAFGNHVDCCRA